MSILIFEVNGRTKLRDQTQFGFHVANDDGDVGCDDLRKKPMNREKANRKRRRNNLTVSRPVSLKNISTVSTKRLRLLTGGMYSVSGDDEKATTINNCSIDYVTQTGSRIICQREERRLLLRRWRKVK